ncbi:MAG: hypothetical protein WD355_09630 [Balneolaceae bacterium]
MQISFTIDTVFLFILTIFTIGSTFLSCYSILNAARLRNVRLSWKSGKIFGYPLFATIFLVSATLFGGFVYESELNQYYLMAGCYGWVGLNWFVVSYLTSMRFLTDNGIVKNINDPSQTVAWHEIGDYVEKVSETGSDYIFFYRERGIDEAAVKTALRLDLFVPPAQVEEFRKVVSYKLGRTLNRSVESIVNVKTVE